MGDDFSFGVDIARIKKSKRDDIVASYSQFEKMWIAHIRVDPPGENGRTRFVSFNSYVIGGLIEGLRKVQDFVAEREAEGRAKVAARQEATGAPDPEQGPDWLDAPWRGD